MVSSSLGSISNFPTMLFSRRHGSLFTGQWPLLLRHSQLATRHQPTRQDRLRSPARFRLGSSQVAMCQRLTPEQFGFVWALSYHRRLLPFSFTSALATLVLMSSSDFCPILVVLTGVLGHSRALGSLWLEASVLHLRFDAPHDTSGGFLSFVSCHWKKPGNCMEEWDLIS